jgi:putative ABC transport system permease protein
VPDLLRTLRYSLRMLRKNPGLTAAVIATLALGIGATTAIYTVVYATLLAPLPYPEPNQLVVVWSKIQGERNVLSAGDFHDWREQNKSFVSLNAMTGGSFDLATKDRPEQVNGNRLTPGFFNMMGYTFFKGRDFLPEEGTAGKDHVAIMTHKLWERLGANDNIIGQTMTINREPYTVVGVLPPGMADRADGQLTVPLTFKPEQINHDYHWLLAFGRLKPGVTLAQAQADMDAVTNHIAADHPQSNKGWGAFVDPLKDDFLPKDRIHNLWLLLGAVGFVLLIACVNIANLLLAKGAARQQEIAVRGALGANRQQVFVQFLLESLVLALIGGVLGVALGEAMLRLVETLIPQGTLPIEAELQLSLPILSLAFIATTFAGLLFGCAPAWYASRVEPGELLKEGGRSGSGATRHRLRSVLIIGEFSLALALLAGAGLAIHSFWNLTRVDLGVQTDHVLTFGLGQPEGRFHSPEEMDLYYRQILSSLSAAAGVSHAAVVTGLPLRGPNNGMPFTIVGGPTYSDPSQRPGAGFQSITPDYYSTFGIQILKGRAFTEQDTATSVRVAMVNQYFVNRYFKDKNPLGQRLSIEQIAPGVQKLGPAVEWQIVGVFHNVRAGGFREDFPEIDVPFSQSLSPDVAIGVRTVEDPAAMTKTINAAIHSVDSQVALARIRTLDQVKDESLANDRFTMFLYGSFAAIALALAGVGIYGLMAFAVSQRTHEIGLRMALGASRNHVTALIVKEASFLAVIGLVLGMAGAFLVGRAMHSTLYGVGTMDFWVIAAVAVLLFATALVASYLPGRRAASIDPLEALRTE